MKTSLLLIFAVGLAFAQDPRSSVNPFDIQQRIANSCDLKVSICDHNFDVAELWRSLGISAALKAVWSHPVRDWVGNEEATTFSKCRVACVAEISRENLDGEPDQELILRVHERYGFCRFLFFKAVPNSSNRWQFLGYADHDFARYYDPTYRVRFFNNGKRFFVMHAHGTSGTGISLDYDRWYEVSSAGVREVLTLPSGDECATSQSVCKTFSSAMTSYMAEGSGDRFTVTFTINYFADPCAWTIAGCSASADATQGPSGNLFTRIQRAVFLRPAGDQDFNLAPAESDITMDEIRHVYNVGEPTCAEFIGGNLSNLVRIARGPKSMTTEWIRGYAERCEPSRQRTMLLNALH